MNNKNISIIMGILEQERNRFDKTSLAKLSVHNRPFQILISCLISLRTKDEVTEKASFRLFREAPSPKKLAALSIKRIEKLIYPAGFYITKAKRIKEIAKQIDEKYAGKVPDSIEELLRFKGVGRKTANIVITFGFGKPGIAVDTHVHRISNRLGYVRTKTPEQTEFALRKKLPEKYWIEYNDFLVSYGQNVCRPISPLCSACKIRKYCKRVGVGRSR